MSPENLDNPARIRIRRRVAWMDTDAAGIYHWSTVIRFAEEAEAELHTALGISEITFGATPRVKAGFEFRLPLRFNDPAWIDLSVTRVGRSSVRYEAIVRDAGEQLVAEGEVVTVFIDPETRRSAPWPEPVRAALSAGGVQLAEGRPEPV
jgi:YbgC/YbaW family acyl-CoA thioester hydrolase